MSPRLLMRPETPREVAHQVHEPWEARETWVPVVNHMIQVVRPDSGRFQTPSDAVHGELDRVLLTEESLLLDESEQLAVAHDCRSGVVAIAVEAENMHRYLDPWIAAVTNDRQVEVRQPISSRRMRPVYAAALRHPPLVLRVG